MVIAPIVGVTAVDAPQGWWEQCLLPHVGVFHVLDEGTQWGIADCQPPGLLAHTKTPEIRPQEEQWQVACRHCLPDPPLQLPILPIWTCKILSEEVKVTY